MNSWKSGDKYKRNFTWYQLFDCCMILNQVAWTIISLILAAIFVGGFIQGWGR